MSLELLSQLSEGSASIRNDTFSIDGVARDRASYELALEDIGNGLNGGMKFGSANILPPASAPFQWQVEKTPDGVVVSGDAPDLEFAKKVAEMVGTKLGVESVTDLQKTTAGMPDKFDQVQLLAASLLARLDSGMVQMSGKAVSVTGEATSKEVEEAVSAALINALPAGYKGSSRITIAAPSQNAAACENLINTTIDGRQILFAVNRATILGESRSVLADIASAAQECPKFSIEIHGHTDSDGSESYNQKLSDGRAAAVMKNLIDAGVAAERLNASGFGETRPIADNDTDEGKARNRRIEFKVKERE